MGLFVINAATRAVASLVEAAHFIGEKRKVFLVIQQLKESTVIDGHSVSGREAKVRDFPFVFVCL